MASTRTSARHALHAAAEWLMAGPQHAASGTIRLQVTDLGVATRDGGVVLGPDGLVAGSDAARLTPWGRTLRSMADEAGIDPTVPEGLYADHAALGLDDALEVDPDQVRQLLAWFARGRQGLVDFAPSEQPVLWPEHFDLAIAVNEVNYGVSLGDDHHESPYAYVGPWQPRKGTFWNAPFGATRAADELPDPPAVSAFFAEGARLAAVEGATGG